MDRKCSEVKYSADRQLSGDIFDFVLEGIESREDNSTESTPYSFEEVHKRLITKYFGTVSEPPALTTSKLSKPPAIPNSNPLLLASSSKLPNPPQDNSSKPQNLTTEHKEKLNSSNSSESDNANNQNLT